VFKLSLWPSVVNQLCCHCAETPNTDVCILDRSLIITKTKLKWLKPRVGLWRKRRGL